MPWRYDVVGYLGGDFGLGVAARNSVRALEASRRLAATISVEERPPESTGDYLRHILGRASGPASERTPRTIESSEPLVTLFQMNPLEIAWHTSQWRPGVEPGSRHVCVPFWEMPLVPRAWGPMLGAMDAVLAPTRFVQAACAHVVGPDRVMHYPQAVFLPEGVKPDRDAWGLPGGHVAFVVSFDVGSDIDRKNPWTSVDAFQAAFPAEKDVLLVVKTKPWANVPQFVTQLEALRARVTGDERIRIVDRTLSYAEVLSLYASCDVMLSLHRSEGLGLHLMEAMSLGKVVVATGWSGNMDFMTEENSVPVPYRMVPVRTDHPHYLSEVGRPGQEWAEASVDEAVVRLRALREDATRRRRLGEAAARDMARRRDALLRGDVFAELERKLPELGSRGMAFDAAILRTRAHAITRAVRARIQQLRRRRA